VCGVVPVEVGGVRTLLYRYPPPSLCYDRGDSSSAADHQACRLIRSPRPEDALPAPRTRLQSRIRHRGVPRHRQRLRRRGVPDPKPCVGVVPVEVGGCQDPSVPLPTNTLLLAIVASPVPPRATTNVPGDTFPASGGHCAPAPLKAAVTDPDTVVFPVTANACVGAAFPIPSRVVLSQWS
jgi:hypothetical protein